MKDITDLYAGRAIAAIDSGNKDQLQGLITGHAWLVRERLHNQQEGYFKDPYLLWFAAGNPIRVNKLPSNILEIMHLLIQAVKHEAGHTWQQQLNYTLGLVASGRVPRESGVQIQMIDMLIDNGASPDGAINALAHRSVEAAQHLIDRGDRLTLAVAVCLEGTKEIDNLAATATPDEKLTALTAAAFYGKADMIKRLLEMNTNPNGYPATVSRFHTHGTPLHQAVSSGSLECVTLLVESGARLHARDKIYNRTPLEWAAHMKSENSFDEVKKGNFALIETYLRNFSGNPLV